MNLWQSILLGIIQGLTEFYPVSSSTHLKLFKKFLNIQETGHLFDLVCHMGTLLALILFLRKEILLLFKNPRLFYNYIIALLPLPLVYFLLKGYLNGVGSLYMTGIFLFLTGIILFLASFFSKKSPSYKSFNMLNVGLMQAFALVPGFSRSGLTISMGCFQGWSLQESVKFSFVLSIPTISGGMLLETLTSPLIATTSFFSYLVAFFFSFLIGFFAIRGIFSLKNKKSLVFFAIYCMILGSYLYLTF